MALHFDEMTRDIQALFDKVDLQSFRSHTAIPEAWDIDQMVIYLVVKDIVYFDHGHLQVDCGGLLMPEADDEDIESRKDVFDLCRLYLEDPDNAVLRWVAAKRGVEPIRWDDPRQQEKVMTQEECLRIVFGALESCHDRGHVDKEFFHSIKTQVERTLKEPTPKKKPEENIMEVFICSNCCKGYEIPKGTENGARGLPVCPWCGVPGNNPGRVKKPSGVRTETSFVVGFDNITKADRRKLKERRTQFFCEEFGDGYRISVYKRLLSEVEDSSMSPAFLTAIQAAISAGVDWLVIDADETNDDLEIVEED